MPALGQILPSLMLSAGKFVQRSGIWVQAALHARSFCTILERRKLQALAAEVREASPLIMHDHCLMGNTSGMAVCMALSCIDKLTRHIVGVGGPVRFNRLANTFYVADLDDVYQDIRPSMGTAAPMTSAASLWILGA